MPCVQIEENAIRIAVVVQKAGTREQLQSSGVFLVCTGTFVTRRECVSEGKPELHESGVSFSKCRQTVRRLAASWARRREHDVVTSRSCTSVQFEPRTSYPKTFSLLDKGLDHQKCVLR